MKQIQVHKFTPEDPLASALLVDVSIPSPGPGQVLVRLTMMPIHRADKHAMGGMYPGWKPTKFPIVPGFEGVGVIAAIGPNTIIPTDLLDLQVGSRVVPNLALHRDDQERLGGSFSEYCIVSVEDVILVPDSVADQLACQVAVNLLTAMGLLDRLNPPAGAYILQGAGGSTLGKMVIQLAQTRNVHVISTVRRANQVEEVQSYGTVEDIVICTSELSSNDVVAAVMQITDGQGAYGALDPIAGTNTPIFCDAVRPFGTVILFGALAGFAFTGSALCSIFREVKVDGYWLCNDVGVLTPAEKRARLRAAMGYVETGIVVPHAGRRFPLDQFLDAMNESLRPGRSSEGKVLLVADLSGEAC